MTNAEKYREDIEKLDYFFSLKDGKPASCLTTACKECGFENDDYSRTCGICKTKWLLTEYEPPKIESEVYDLKCDDKIEVSDDGKRWFKRHFKCIEDNLVVVWNNGKTSFSADNKNSVAEWEYARIPREE